MRMRVELNGLVILQKGAFVSEPAILVKRVKMASQVWSMDKLENKLIDMRETYDEKGLDNKVN